MNQALNKILPKPGQPASAAPQFLCQLSNISECLPIQNQTRVIQSLLFHCISIRHPHCVFFCH